MKPQVYVDPRPAEMFDHYHRRVREQGAEASQAVFDRIRVMYGALRANGRRGVLKALRERHSPGAPVTG